MAEGAALEPSSLQTDLPAPHVVFPVEKGEQGFNRISAAPPRPVGREQHEQALHLRGGPQGREPGWRRALHLSSAGVASPRLLQGQEALGPCSTAARGGKTPPRAESSAHAAWCRVSPGLSARNKVAALINVPDPCPPSPCCFVICCLLITVKIRSVSSILAV